MLLFYAFKLKRAPRTVQVPTHLSGSRSYLLNGFPMFPSAPGPCRPPSAGPAVPPLGRCFRSGSLSSREPVVPLSCSAVSELFRFRITGNVNKKNKQILTRGAPTERRAVTVGLSAGSRPLAGRVMEQWEPLRTVLSPRSASSSLPSLRSAESH